MTDARAHAATPSPAPLPGRILALDVGRARIGVAVSDTEQQIASPHSVLQRRGKKSDLPAVERLCRELEARTVVVGLPLAVDGSLTEMAGEIQRFADRLRSFLPEDIAVTTWDEALTTSEAEDLLRDRGVHGKKRRGLVDQVAAAFILESYLRAVQEKRA